MNTKNSTVVIVGRPNVGKSTFFNRIIGQRDAIVDDQPGVTRDTKYRLAEWSGRHFTLVDTGGLFGSEGDPYSADVQKRIEMTSREAALLLVMFDGRTGPTSVDQDVVAHLRKLRVPIIGVVNKVDNMRKEMEAMAPFYEMGLDQLYAISSAQGLGTGDLLDAVIEYIPEEAQPEETTIPHIAILGRPNVGKSTLLNALYGSDRALVSPMAGTTRDPVDVQIEYEGTFYRFIDTAGLKRKSKMSQGIDRYSLVRVEQTLELSHVALLMVDAVEGLTETDAKVFGKAHEKGRAAMILVNKWDLVEKDEATAGTFAKEIRYRMPFLHYAPIEFISALTQKRVHRVFSHIDRILANYRRRAATGELNRLLEDILAHHPPPIHKGRAPKIFYWTQAEVEPPTFVAFVSDPEAIHFSYQRYLVNQLYEAFDFKGTPVRLILRKRQGSHSRP